MAGELSDDLKPILELELSLGNDVEVTLRDTSTGVPFVLVMKHPMHINTAMETLGLPTTVELYKQLDEHYPPEIGFRSTVTGHYIVGPMDGRQIYVRC